MGKGGRPRSISPSKETGPEEQTGKRRQCKADDCATWLSRFNSKKLCHLCQAKEHKREQFDVGGRRVP